MAGERQLRGTGAPPGVPARLAEWGGSQGRSVSEGPQTAAILFRGAKGAARRKIVVRLRLQRSREGEARLLPARPSTRLLWAQVLGRKIRKSGNWNICSKAMAGKVIVRLLSFGRDAAVFRPRSQTTARSHPSKCRAFRCGNWLIEQAPLLCQVERGGKITVAPPIT